MNNLYFIGALLYWTSQLCLASYSHYYHPSNLFHPNYAFDPYAFTQPIINPYSPIAQYPELNADQVHQIIHFQPAPQFNVIHPGLNYYEQTEAPNSTDAEDMNYSIELPRASIIPSQANVIMDLSQAQNEEYHGFTYRTQYEGGGHSNVVFYTGKGSHKLMFPSNQRQDKSVTLTARTIASDSLDVNFRQENDTSTLHQEAPEITSENPPSTSSLSSNTDTTINVKLAETTLTNAPEDFSVDEATSINTPTTEQDKNSTQIDLTTETENITTDNSLNSTTTISSSK